MSIASEITRLQSAKADLKTAIEGKGVTVPSATLLDGYADLVDDIPSGGGGVKHKTGSYIPSATYNTVGNQEITNISAIGFTPTHFIFSVDNEQDVSGQQYAILIAGFITSLSGTLVLRSMGRYSNTSGSTSGAATVGALTTAANNHLHISDDKIYFRTSTNGFLLKDVKYNWEAFEV